MGLFFLLILIIWGWAEMSVFISIGAEIGGLLTLMGIFFTAVIGLSLLKSQGKVVMARLRSDMAQGRTPVGSIADSIALTFGGLLMLIPGYVTDTLGLLLFVPGLRTFAGTWILHHLFNNNRFRGFVHVDGKTGFDDQMSRSFDGNDDVIEGNATEHEQKKLAK